VASPPPTAGPRLRLVHSEPDAPPEGPGGKATVALDDYELLAAVRSGDDTAATAFYHRVRPRVDATIARMLGSRDSDADDLAQIALVELVRSIHRFRGECSLDSWTSRVTAHMVCKQIRRRRIERGIFEHVAVEPVDAARMGPAVIARNLLERIRGHLNGMDPDKAFAFVLHDVCGFDLREAAQILEVSVAATQKRLVRGRRELHALLGADPDLVDLLTEGDGP
jgi:RNA polymerase sigma-70 factor (ECF subfamily)